MEILMSKDTFLSLVVSSQNRRNAERHILKQCEPGYHGFEPNIRAYYDPHDMATIRYIDELPPYITALRLNAETVYM